MNTSIPLILALEQIPLGTHIIHNSKLIFETYHPM